MIAAPSSPFSPPAPGERLSPPHLIRRQLRQKFVQLGADPSQPGFYDHPAFRQHAQTDPALGVDYARYVFALEHSRPSLRRARSIVQRAATFLHSELAQDSRPGLCLDTARLLSRFLERQGVWNVAVSGAFRATVPSGHQVSFGPISTREGAGFTAHAWVYAPPFSVVDVTLQQQTLPAWVLAQLPAVVLQEETGTGVLQGPELFSSRGRTLFEGQWGRLPTLEDAVALMPGMGTALLRFPHVAFSRHGQEFLYAPLSPRFLNGAFEAASPLRHNGKSPAALYQQFLETSPVPKLT